MTVVNYWIDLPYENELISVAGADNTAQFATTANLGWTYDNVTLTLTNPVNGAMAVTDGYTPLVGDQVLVWQETSLLTNGFYIITQLGTSGTPTILTRDEDADESLELDQQVVFVIKGTLYGGKYFTQQTAVPIVGTSDIVYVKGYGVMGTPALPLNSVQINVNGEFGGFDNFIYEAGAVRLKADAGDEPTELHFYEKAVNGSDYAGFKAAADMLATTTYILPDRGPSAGQVLTASAPVSNISTLSWATVSGGGGISYTDEMAQDAVASLLVAGTNITLTYNDAANTLTIAAAGGGGGTAPVGSNFAIQFNDNGVFGADDNLLYDYFTGLLYINTIPYAFPGSQGAASTVLTNNGSGVLSWASVPAGYTNEMAQDTVAAMIQNGTGITWSYNDVTNTLTPAITITQYTDEMAQDTVAAMIQNGTGITWSYNDTLGTLTPTVTASSYTDEQAQDAVAAALVAGTNVTITYNDALNTITVASSATVAQPNKQIVYGTGTGITSASTFVYDAGKVGIGIALPLHPLHVKGAGATSATTAFHVENSTGTQSLSSKDDGTIWRNGNKFSLTHLEVQLHGVRTLCFPLLIRQNR